MLTAPRASSVPIAAQPPSALAVAIGAPATRAPTTRSAPPPQLPDSARAGRAGATGGRRPAGGAPAGGSETELRRAPTPTRVKPAAVTISGRPKRAVVPEWRCSASPTATVRKPPATHHTTGRDRRDASAA